GSNFHCVLEEAEPEKVAVDWDGDVQVLAFSADDRAAVGHEIEALMPWPTWPEVRAAGARSRASFRPDHRYRLVIVAGRTDGDWDGLMAEARARLVALPGPDTLQEPMPRPAVRTATPRVFAGAGPRPGGLALLFPGQGSQYVGMFRELACLFPRMQAALAGM